MTSDIDSLVARAESLVRSKDYRGAAEAADAVLKNRSALSKAAVVRANALLFPLLDQLMDGSRDNPSRAEFKEAAHMFTLALTLDPENEVGIPQKGGPKQTLIHNDPYCRDSQKIP